MFRAQRLLLALFFALILILPACSDPRADVQAIYDLSVSSGRSKAAHQLQLDYYAGKLTVQDVLTNAHERLDQTPSPASALFAGVVLDALAVIEPDIDTSKTNEFLWIRMGTLAANAATAAMNSKPPDLALAESLVLAGPQRWRNSAYFNQHPDHDILVSMIQFREALSRNDFPKASAAVARLKDRQGTHDTIDQAIAAMEHELRNRPRPR